MRPIQVKVKLCEAYKVKVKLCEAYTGKGQVM